MKSTLHKDDQLTYVKDHVVKNAAFKKFYTKLQLLTKFRKIEVTHENTILGQSEILSI